MNRHLLGNVLASVLGIAVGLLTIYISYTRLKEPQILLDWLALVFSGLTTGAITFFITWGHFQDDPVPPKTQG